jgi:hypothetical protein
MAVLNDLDRFHLMIERDRPRSRAWSRAAAVKWLMVEKLAEHTCHTHAQEDLPEMPRDKLTVRVDGDVGSPSRTRSPWRHPRARPRLRGGPDAAFPADVHLSRELDTTKSDAALKDRRLLCVIRSALMTLVRTVALGADFFNSC